MNGNEMAAPRPVPDLTVGSVPGEVSDEERNRDRVLLDHAAERGLLTAAEYQVRLAELADATSIEQLQRIVTEFPAFGGRRPRLDGRDPGRRRAAPAPVPGAHTGTRRRTVGQPDAGDTASPGNPWLILIVIVILVVALV